MKLNVKAMAIAEALVGGALALLCRVAFVVAPQTTLAILKYVTHNDWSQMAMPVTLGGTISGVIIFAIFLAIVGAAWASIYNRLATESRVTSTRAAATKPGKLAYQMLHLE